VDLDVRKVRYWRAAERLHVAQPVADAPDRSLERDLCANLLERARAGTRLSAAG
jgi:DNA-binding transcriptional LysR family regulator